MKKNGIINLVVTLSFGLCGFANLAQGSDSSSGCGPGWYVLKENSLVSSALRITTNGILFPVVTLGMTFGTSNCTQHKLVLKEQESLHFATMNHFELKSAVARGEGEYLNAFSEVIGCSHSAQTRFNDQLKSRYNELYPDNSINPQKVLTEVYKIVIQDKDLVSQCSLGVG